MRIFPDIGTAGVVVGIVVVPVAGVLLLGAVQDVEIRHKMNSTICEIKNKKMIK